MANSSLAAKIDFNISQREQDRFLVFVQKEILDQIYKRLKDITGYIQKEIGNVIKKQIRYSPGFEELYSGHLRYDMGLRPDEVVRVTEQIIEILQKDIQIDIKRTANSIDLSIKFVASDYSEILGLEEASFTSEPKNRPGTKVNWLEWLLTRGDEIVADYHVIYTREKPAEGSRSGGAFMKIGGGWRVPPEWSSSDARGNLIIRSFEDIDLLVIGILKDQI